ncbi:hypothetical protein Trydic_g15984 [Trypoxylus dichotomus]
MAKYRTCSGKELPRIKDTGLIFNTEADSILSIPSTSKAATDSLSGNGPHSVLRNLGVTRSNDLTPKARK